MLQYTHPNRSVAIEVNVSFNGHGSSPMIFVSVLIDMKIKTMFSTMVQVHVI